MNTFEAIGKASYFHPVKQDLWDGISKISYIAKLRVYGRYLHCGGGSNPNHHYPRKDGDRLNCLGLG